MFTTERKDIGILLINQHVRIIDYRAVCKLILSRLLSGYVTESIPTQLLSQHFSKSPARITHMTPRRIVS
jgi:hypothetical protein